MTNWNRNLTAEQSREKWDQRTPLLFCVETSVECTVLAYIVIKLSNFISSLYQRQYRHNIVVASNESIYISILNYTRKHNVRITSVLCTRNILYTWSQQCVQRQVHIKVTANLWLTSGELRWDSRKKKNEIHRRTFLWWKNKKK